MISAIPLPGVPPTGVVAGMEIIQEALVSQIKIALVRPKVTASKIRYLHTGSTSSAKGQGTDKHFYCVMVFDYRDAAIVWEKTDCTGQSCFIPGNGAYSTWSFGAQANCIDIAPETPVNTVPCLSPGEHGKAPCQGGYPAGISIPVGGQYGGPASYNNSQTCSSLWKSLPDFQGDSPVPNPPSGDGGQAFLDDDSGDLWGAQLDKRQAGRSVNSLTTVQGLRRGKPSSLASVYGQAKKT